VQQRRWQRRRPRQSHVIKLNLILLFLVAARPTARPQARLLRAEEEEESAVTAFICLT
jgi:hypothetical protein